MCVIWLYCHLMSPCVNDISSSVYSEDGPLQTINIQFFINSNTSLRFFDDSSFSTNIKVFIFVLNN